jgi:hypothetical protein
MESSAFQNAVAATLDCAGGGIKKCGSETDIGVFSDRPDRSGDA